MNVPATEDAVRARTPILVIQQGSHRCAVPVAHVVETMRPLPIQAVADAPAFVLGLAVIRGAPVPVVDLRSLLQGPEEAGDGPAKAGKGPAEAGHDVRGEGPAKAGHYVRREADVRHEATAGRFVVLKVGQRRVALAVETVVGVRAMLPSTLQELPPLLAHAAGLIEAIGILDAQLLVVLRTARLLPDEVWPTLAIPEDRP